MHFIMNLFLYLILFLHDKNTPLLVQATNNINLRQINNPLLVFTIILTSKLLGNWIFWITVWSQKITTQSETSMKALLSCIIRSLPCRVQISNCSSNTICLDMSWLVESKRNTYVRYNTVGEAMECVFNYYGHVVKDYKNYALLELEFIIISRSDSSWNLIFNRISIRLLSIKFEN